MKLINPILQTINNTLHIKADNLEPVEVDSSCVDDFRNIAHVEWLNTECSLTFGEYLRRNKIDISELSDSIEVRDFETYPITKRAFLLPVKEIDDSLNVVLDNQKELELCLEIADKKSYTIEEIEKAIDKLPFSQVLRNTIKVDVNNNLKK